MKRLPSVIFHRRSILAIFILVAVIALQLTFLRPLQQQDAVDEPAQIAAKQQGLILPPLPQTQVEKPKIEDFYIKEQPLIIEKTSSEPEIRKTAKAIVTAKKDIATTPKIKPPLVSEQSSKIVIIIDDVGINHKMSEATVNFNEPLTLAFLPYGENTQGFIDRAAQKKHEIMVHFPMEPIDETVNPGPNAARVGMSEVELKRLFETELSKLHGFDGVNNHMGSRFTQDYAGMSTFMDVLKEKDLFFVDSKTIGNSVGTSTAIEKGVANLTRDVFLDHVETPEFVNSALQKLEKAALKNGYAVAIGHPKEVTLNALATWIPDARSRGFEIVRAGDLIREIRLSNRELPVSEKNTQDTQEKTALLKSF